MLWEISGEVVEEFSGVLETMYEGSCGAMLLFFWNFVDYFSRNLIETAPNRSPSGLNYLKAEMQCFYGLQTVWMAIFGVLVAKFGPK